MRRWLAIALGVVALAIGAWLVARMLSRPPAAQNLTILFTGDVRGRLVPCGCFSGQLGGLTRIATMVGLGHQPGYLKVDVGDAIQGAADFEVMEYRSIQRAFGAMGYEALNLGHREAQLSASTLRELKKTSPVPMLSANLLDAATHAPIFDAWRIVHRGSWRIALIGVMDARPAGEAPGEGLAIENVEVTLSRLLPVVKAKADCIVLLAFASDERIAELARQFYELDIILGGDVKQPSQKLVRENRSMILATTNQSRALGTLSISRSGASNVAPISGEILLVGESIPQNPVIAALAASYREEVRQARLAIDDPANLQRDMIPGVRAAAAYAGTESCTACHPGAAAKWRETGHARAWSTLVDAGADADPNCLSCHTVGFGVPGGYLRAFGGTKLVNVGCESCHGPGSQHVAQRQAGGEVTTHLRPLGEGDCVKCHHGEFSRPFDYAQFWPLIDHGKESGTPASR